MVFVRVLCRCVYLHLCSFVSKCHSTLLCSPASSCVRLSASILGPKVALLTDGFCCLRQCSKYFGATTSNWTKTLSFTFSAIRCPLPTLRKKLTYWKFGLIHHKLINNKSLIQKGSSSVNAAMIGPSQSLSLSSRPSVTCRPDT
jgi:hypothetical protein